jgi:hypothetical protein
MIKLEDISSEISFDEPTHVYKNKKGKILTSVTTCLGEYKEKFDPTGIIALMCAKRAGISKDEMLNKWKIENKRACDYGHSVHAQIEHFLKTQEIKDTPEKDIVEDFSKIEFKGKIYSELRLKSDKFSLAGTCDIATLDKKMVSIHDLKTNKAFNIKSKYGNKFLYPLNDLDENHLTSYSLQIIIYGEMVKEHGYDFIPGQILWINPKTRKIEKYDVLDLRKEASRLLHHFKSIQDF